MKWAAAIALLSLLAGCGSRGGDAVPLPEAYPRINIYPEDYIATDLGGLSIETNRGAAVTDHRDGPEGARWLTLAYPRYGALLYLTLTPVSAATLDEVVGNRLERMRLNAGSGTTVFGEMTGRGGWRAQVARTPAGTVTPLQFIAVSPRADRVLSGALFMGSADTASSPDSLAPAVDAVERDIVHAVNSLR